MVGAGTDPSRGIPWMTAFAGIDFSTFAIDLVLIPEEGEPEWHRFELAGHDAFERTRGVRDVMPSRGWWSDLGVVALGIEEPQGVAKSTVAKLKAIQGAVVACLPRDLLVHPMVPARWRTEVGLKGNASKEEVADFVAVRSGTGFVEIPWDCSQWSQDAMDAYCLALSVEKLTVLA